MNWPVFPGKGTKVSLTEELPEFREVEAAEGPLLLPITACPGGVQASARDPGGKGWSDRPRAHETATPGEGWGGGRSAQTSRERVVRGGRSREGSQGRLERSSSALRLTTSSSSPTLAALLPNSVEFSYFMRVTIIFIVSPMSKARIHVLSRK